MDDEVKNAGNTVNFKYRVHDSRLGRFLSLDPLAKEFAHNSPFAFSENRVIDAYELEGLESAKYTYKWNAESQAYDMPIRIGLFPSVPNSGAIHEFVGGPDIRSGYDKRVIFNPGPNALAGGYNKFVKNPSTVLSEYAPYLSISNRTYTGGELELKSRSVGGKVGVEYILNESTLKLNSDGFSLENKQGFVEITGGLNLLQGSIGIDLTKASTGEETGTATVLGIQIEGTTDAKNMETGTQIFIERTISDVQSGSVRNTTEIQFGLERKEPSSTNSKGD